MPAPATRRLTEADYPRLIADQARGHPTADIARTLGCSVGQVQRALRQLGLNTGFKHARTRPSTVRICRAQYELVVWHEKGAFSIRDLAERLGSCSWLILERELRGNQRMSSRRIAALQELVQQLDPAVGPATTLAS